uniref:PRELI/MSF1 domain-containing protein n=1 Tax=Panagrellus redivivus TaxID=6233 RepID=A0A7E4W0M2_PANRE
MKFWTAPIHIFDYTFNEVSAVFYDRYPNSFAKHVVSEDVLERKVTEDSIYTRKLVVKKGASFLKSVPSWMSRLTSIRTVPTLEESIYDRKTETLVTYTRNVSFVDLFAMDEKSVYKRVESTPTQTSLSRDVAVYVNYPRFGGLIERVLVMTFRKSVKKTLNGIQEKLEERILFWGFVVVDSCCNAWSVLLGRIMVPSSSSPVWKILATASLVSLLHCAYSAAQHNSFVRLTGQEASALPLDLQIQTLVSLVVCIFATTFLAGDFQPIRADKEAVTKTWDTVGSCPSFYTFNHRAQCLSPQFLD